MTSRAPDLLVVMRNYAYMTRDGAEFACQDLFSKPQSGHDGNHRLNGLFMAMPWSRPAASLPFLRRQDILDIAPTALAWLGIEVPPYMDGRPIPEITGDITTSSLAGHLSSDTEASTQSHGMVSSPEDRAMLMERMQALGYMA